jgi:peptidoglycan hydrolase-like protein with peptidoglycan-binding domain
MGERDYAPSQFDSGQEQATEAAAGSPSTLGYYVQQLGPAGAQRALQRRLARRRPQPTVGDGPAAAARASAPPAETETATEERDGQAFGGHGLGEDGPADPPDPDADVVGNPLRGLAKGDGDSRNKFKRQLGGAVKKLQDKLNQQVTPSPGLTANGVFDDATLAALRAFQTTHQLPEAKNAVDDRTADLLWTGSDKPTQLPVANAHDPNNPLFGLRPGDGVVAGRNDATFQARVQKLQTALNQRVPAELNVDGKFLLDNDTLLTYHKFQREIGETPDNGAVSARAADLLQSGEVKKKKPGPQPPKPVPHPPHTTGIVGLKYGDGTTPDTVGLKPYVRKLQQLLNEKMQALLQLNGEFDDETLAVLHDFQAKNQLPTKDEVDQATANLLEGQQPQPQPTPWPQMNPELEDLLDAIWLQMQLDMQHGNNALNQLGVDLKKDAPKVKPGWKIGLEFILRTGLSMLLGDGLPNMIGAALKFTDDRTKEHWVDFVIKPPFDAGKDQAGDEVKGVVKNLVDPDSPEKSVDDFVEVQRQTMTGVLGDMQQKFVLESKKEARQFLPEDLDGKVKHAKDPRVERAESTLLTEQKKRQDFFAKQYDAGLAAWATLLAQADLGPKQQDPNNPQGTALTMDPNTDRDKRGIMNATFNAIHNEPDAEVVVAGSPTVRGVPPEALAHLKGRPFSDLNMPIVAKVQVSLGGNYGEPPTYDIDLEATEDFGSYVDSKGQKVLSERNFHRESNKPARAREYLSRKVNKTAPPTDAMADDGMFKTINEEIAGNSIPDVKGS